nr:unnamed protein product [Spirometra erinaceieuropaei]
MSSCGARPAGPAGNKGYSPCRRVDRPSFRHLQDVDSPTASQETSGELSQRLASPLVAAAVAAATAAVADENASVENRWCQLQGTVQSTALTVLGHTRRQHQDWFDDKDADISNLRSEKNRLHKAYDNRPTDASKAAFYRSRRLVQQRLREMQGVWMAPSADRSTLLIKKTQILQQWAEHFRAVLNCLSTISNIAIICLSLVETDDDLDGSPSLHETIRAGQ